MPEGVDFPFPSLLFHEGRTYGQPGIWIRSRNLSDSKSSERADLYHLSPKHKNLPDE